MKNKISEHELQNLIKQWLELHGWFCLRLNSGMIPTYTFKGVKHMIKHMVRLSPAGTPDLFALKKGKCVFIEVKVGSNKLTKYQELMLDNIEIHGGQTIVAYSLEDVIRSI